MKPATRPKCDADAYAEQVRARVDQLKATLDCDALTQQVREDLAEALDNCVAAVRVDLGLPAEPPIKDGTLLFQGRIARSDTPYSWDVSIEPPLAPV